MSTNKAPLIIIAIIIIAGIAGVVVYGISQNNKPTTQPDGHTHSHSDTSSTANSDAEATDTVSIQDFAYSPAAIKVKVGTKVTWTNNDSVQHNVVGDDFEDLNGPLLSKGESFSYVFEKAGTYNYHCMPHPYMKGTVIVTE